jgi:hypothetical protein
MDRDEVLRCFDEQTLPTTSAGNHSIGAGYSPGGALQDSTGTPARTAASAPLTITLDARRAATNARPAAFPPAPRSSSAWDRAPGRP